MFSIFTLVYGWGGGGGRVLCICLPNSKTIAPIDFIFLHKKENTRGSVLV